MGPEQRSGGSPLPPPSILALQNPTGRRVCRSLRLIPTASPQGPAQAFALPSLHPAIGRGKKCPEKNPRQPKLVRRSRRHFCTPAEIRGAAEEREDVYTYRLGCNKKHKSYRELTHRSGVLGRKKERKCLKIKENNKEKKKLTSSSFLFFFF